ncbi:DUF2798 domain-containing protein [Allosediminivita pacifica]|uniref:Uncharacterized protein DUF2798 n=1 Tax=Allosediminivita pacifica TaxID=1267769 RepID=A0A2T6AX09_9RHOB|nr:DUF2798 domain-containing protein [Allosediminivita pacifica]PTX48339.1 uncharacterized protein DUF2798 [Allosediminivita pacifica]GGB11212.1 hypothetical protein GCM10011324_21700 [Allosediminivita pacifica]
MDKAKSTLILAQVMISGSMSFLMTLIFRAIPTVGIPGWFTDWLVGWLVAWPVAFVLSIIVGRTAFALAGRITRLTEPA